MPVVHEIRAARTSGAAAPLAVAGPGTRLFFAKSAANQTTAEVHHELQQGTQAKANQATCPYGSNFGQSD
jgi:hypothetical protein